MAYEQLETRVLRQLVVDRQKAVEAIISTAQTLAQKYGECTSYKEHSCHTTSTHELKDFKGFDIHTHGAYTRFGGENLRIYYRTKLVFEAEWWEIEKVDVKTFDNDLAWRKAFAHLKRCAAKVHEARLKKAERERKAEEARHTDELEQQKLLGDADRLKLNV